VDGVDLAVRQGETMGLVGESGSGKSTLARVVVKLYQATEGKVLFEGRDITHLGSGAMRPLRRRLQMIFQDPYSSLNPRMTVGEIISEPLKVHHLAPNRSAARERVAELLSLVGMDRDVAARYPYEFSGGQRQRIGIARALAVKPEFVVADEPVSSLDVNIQAQVINLLEDLQDELGLTYLFIAHDLSVVRHVSDRIAVMYLGKIVEIGTSDAVATVPMHPYTKALISAAPVPDAAVERSRARIHLQGEIPSPIDPPSGCRFRTRCPLTKALGNPEICSTVEPPLAEHRPGQSAACHFPEHL
jgi:peptide/nickel transport system ATP-binding protein